MAADVERLLERQPAGVDQRAQHVGREAGALLVGEEGDGQRAGGRDAGLLQRLDDLQAGQHPVVAVEAPARAHGVDVGAGHDRRIPRRTSHSAHDVADGVDRDRQAQVPHPGHDQVAALAVVVGQGEAAAATVAGGAELRQRVQTSGQAGMVGVERGRGGASHRPERGPACTFRQASWRVSS